MSTFESPLLIKDHTQFTAIKFGRVAMTPEVAQLQRALNHHLCEITSELPDSLAAEMRSTLLGYSGDSDFYSLFYVPVWSFLHWLPAATPTPIEPDVVTTAQVAHAMSLFLHLWDDHLCDGQLSVELPRLQFRTIAWRQFSQASHRLCELTEVSPELVEEHIAHYLTSHGNAKPAGHLDEYCGRFSRQFAICTLVPRLLGRGVAGSARGEELYRVVDLFAISWRLLDDIQDIHLDLMQEQQTAVWVELDAAGREKWERCRTLSTSTGELDRKSWAELSQAIRDSGCLERLLSRIDQTLLTAAEIARSNSWDGLARELEQSREGIRGSL